MVIVRKMASDVLILYDVSECFGCFDGRRRRRQEISGKFRTEDEAKRSIHPADVGWFPR